MTSLLMMAEAYNSCSAKTLLTVHITARIRGARLGLGSVGQFVRVRVIIEG